MSVLLSYLAEALYSLNTSLLDLPPPGTEQTGQDVCYWGINGSTDDESVTLCRDLDDGKRFAVGSWYISPRQHAWECCTVTSLCVLVLYRTLPILRRYHHPHRTTTTATQNNVQKAIRPPFALKLITLIAVIFQVYYKAQGYAGKVFFWVMPCNMNWLLLFFLSFFPALSWQASHATLQMCISFSGLAVVALLAPDTSDLVLPLEVPFFFISHTILALYPFYFVVTRQISTLPPAASPQQRTASAVFKNFVSWFCVACSAFGLFYFSVVTPLSIYSGLNLNYMLSPPPNQDLVVGPRYRIVSCASVGAVFFAMRFLTTLVEWIAVSALTSNKPSRKKD